MNATRHQAWRFLHPDLDVPEHESGLQLSPAGTIRMVGDDASIRQSVLLLLSTRPGERVMRPGYGCDLHRLVFSPNDDTTAGLAIHYVRQALSRWEPRVKILKLDARRHDGDPSRLEIILEYRLRTTQVTRALAFSVDLSGEDL